MYSKEKIKRMILDELINDPEYRRAVALVMKDEIKGVVNDE